MKLYLCGLKSYHVDLGLPSGALAFQDERLERAIRRIMREHPEPDRRERTPLTWELLLRILGQHRLSHQTYNSLTLRAVFTLAFAGFLRVGEFTYHRTDLELGPQFRNWFLAKSCIRLSRNQSHMAVHLPALKTDPFRQGIEVLIAASGDEACPVAAMAELQQADRHRGPLEPLFTADQFRKTPFTREYVVSQLCSLAVAADLGAGSWNGHSFRRSTATWAAEVGLPEPQIQVLGRWSSSAYKAYIETSREDRVALSRRFQRFGHS